MYLILEPYVTLSTKKKVIISKLPFIIQVQGILIGVVAAFVIFITIIGPEHHSSKFEKSKTAFEQGGGEIDPESLVKDDPEKVESSSVDEKEITMDQNNSS